MTAPRLARNATASIIQVLVSAGSLMLSYRLMMQWLTIEQIGLWSLIIGSTTVARLSEFGLGGGVLRFVAGDMMRGDREKAAQTLGMAVMVLLVAISALALSLRPLLMRYLLGATPFAMHGIVGILLPQALVVVVLSTLANGFAGALDGCQRMDIRSGVQAVGSLVQLAVTWFVLPRHGAGGLGFAQMAQSLVLLVLGAGAAIWQIGAAPAAYFRVDRRRLREMFTYGGGLQVSGIAQMLFEPLVKVLLTGFAGMALTGYFDMANKIVLQFRSLVIAGYGALVPHVAALSANAGFDRREIGVIYRDAMNSLIFVLLPYYAIAAAAMPLALTLWKGRFDATFVLVTLAMHVGWMVNSFNPPAYFIYMAIGKLRWNVIGQVITGLSVLVLGPIMGYWLGGLGVLLAAVMGLCLGTWFILACFHRDFGVDLRQFVPIWRWPPIGLVVAAIGAAGWVARLPHPPSLMVMIALPLVTGVLALGCGWMDPMRGRLLERMGEYLRRGADARVAKGR